MKNPTSQFYFGEYDIRELLPNVQKKFVDDFSTVELLKENQNDEEKDIISFDPNQQIIWGIDPNEDVAVMPTWKEFFLRRNEGVTKTKLWLEKIHPDDRENTVEIFCEAIVKKIPFTAKFRLQKEDKSYPRLLVWGIPVIENDGRILLWMGTCSGCLRGKKNGNAQNFSHSFSGNNAKLRKLAHYRSRLPNE